MQTGSTDIRYKRQGQRMVPCIALKCDRCSAEVLRETWRHAANLRKGHLAVFCSRDCKSLVSVACHTCGQMFDCAGHRYRKNRSRGLNTYCTPECQRLRGLCVTVDSKTCLGCGVVKHKDEYWRAAGGILGLMAQCKECIGDSHKAHRAKHLYGLEREAFEALIEKGCAICGAPDELRNGRRTLHIDHCHASGVVREALCRGCNHGLGAFADDPERLRAAADYLERHREEVAV